MLVRAVTAFSCAGVLVFAGACSSIQPLTQPHPKTPPRYDCPSGTTSSGWTLSCPAQRSDGSFPTTLWSVFGTARDDVWVGGDGLHHSSDGGATWEARLASVPDVDGDPWPFAGLWASGPNDIYATANCDACFFHSRDGFHWTAETAEGGFFFSRDGLWGVSASDIFSAGNGLMRSKGDDHWTNVTTPDASFDSWNLWGTGPDNIFLAGENGVVSHSADDGATWTLQTIAPTLALWSVWGPSADEVYEVGFEGVIIHTTDRGATWTTQASGTTKNLYAVWGSGPDDVYTGGEGGVLFHTSDRGATWTPEDSGVGSDLGAIWGSGSDDVYAVANDGTILHKQR